jgi:hypothetical protein
LRGKVIADDREVNMDLGEALEQIDSIHAHLARSEQYRGYRPLALALSGVVGLAAALVQPLAVAEGDASGFVGYWVLMALGCALVAGGATMAGYVFREDAVARRRTRVVIRQFLPCLLAGAVATLALVEPQRYESAVNLLPGLWALLYGLGVVASLPYLPRLAGLVVIWYLVTGILLLYLVEGPVPSGWTVGLPFGLGQLLAALILITGRPVEDRA